MTQKPIRVDETFAEWRRDPGYVEAYEALEEEFTLAEAFIRARAQASLTQEQVAARMGTTQAVIARLESGRAKPSTRTLERLAEATGTRLRIGFEPRERKRERTKGPAAPKRPGKPRAHGSWTSSRRKT